jgi:hypothetical protein
MKMLNPRIALSVVAATLCMSPLAVFAQSGETINGTVKSVQGANHLYLYDDRGYVDDVSIRSNTRVALNGPQLLPGERIRISGAADGSTFLANSITAIGPAYATTGPAASYATPAYVSPTVVYAAPVYYPPVYYAPAYPVYRPAFPVSIGLFFHFR